MLNTGQNVSLDEECRHIQWQADAVLVHRVVNGSSDEGRTAFGELVETYQGYIRNLLFGLCGEAALADDLAQDTFILAWRKLDSLRDGAKFQGWLKQLAYRQFLHHQRHQKVVRQYQADQAQATDAQTQISVGVADNLDWARLLTPCTPLERELLVLVYGYEFSLSEIAQARDIPIGTLKSQIHRARQKISKILEKSS